MTKLRSPIDASTSLNAGIRAPGRVSAKDNGRPKAEGKKFLFDNILQDFFRPTNGFIIFRPSSLNIKRQTFLPGERNERPFRDVFFELAHGLKTQLGERWEELLNQLGAFNVPFLACILRRRQSTFRSREVTVGQQGAIGSGSKV